MLTAEQLNLAREGFEQFVRDECRCNGCDERYMTRTLKKKSIGEYADWRTAREWLLWRNGAESISAQKVRP